MTDINTNDYANIGLRTPQETQPERRTELGQADFLALLTTQLANQDPLSPVDNKEFISQMSQFASLDSLQTLVNEFGSLSSSLTSNQALQASALVGRNVLVAGSQGYLADAHGIGGQLNLEKNTDNIYFEIKNSSGELVRRIQVGSQSAGDIDFVWDGNNDAGEQMQQGVYSIAAFGIVNGKNEQLNTSIVSRVESVSLGNSDGKILINLAGLNQIELSEIKQVG